MLPNPMLDFFTNNAGCFLSVSGADISTSVGRSNTKSLHFATKTDADESETRTVPDDGLDESPEYVLACEYIEVVFDLPADADSNVDEIGLIPSL